jgi:lipid-A-disaccharide synthase
MSAAPLFVLVAGEASGDTLGADLIGALRSHFPAAQFVGIGGPKMIAAGLLSRHPLERLAVMGFVEPLKRLPELLRIRRDIVNFCRQQRPAAFIGIDAPDFNLGIAKRLKRAAITTVHYVSPSVWAWRQGRIKGIKKSVDLMLTLLPFEQQFYQQHQVPSLFVGHPLASQLRPGDAATARRQLGISGAPVVALLPGSRSGEVALMAPLYLQVAAQLTASLAGVSFVMPAANPARRAQLDTLLASHPTLPITVIDGAAETAMTAADAVLLTSGTTALEAMLLERPMVVSYKLGEWSYRLVRWLVKTPYVALPNLLAGRPVVAELLQHDATVEQLSAALLELLEPDRGAALVAELRALRGQIELPSSARAAAAIAALVSEPAG